MKKVLLITMSIFVFSCGREKVSERIYFPKNFEGIAMVYYAVPDGIKEKNDAEDWKVIEFPKNGFLLTQYSLPKRVMYRREYYITTKQGIVKIPELRTNDRTVDLKTFKDIDTTKTYIFANLKGGSYCCGERRNGKGGIDFNYENFIVCKPNKYKNYRDKVFDRSYISKGISQCEEDKLCYDRVNMERKFIEVLK